MTPRKIALIVSIFFLLLNIDAQNLRSIKNDLFKDLSWYGSPESIEMAENVLLFQKVNGGWPKNNRLFKKKFSVEEKQTQLDLKKETKEATIDNGATYMEMLFMAKMYQATKNVLYKNAFNNGLAFIFKMQYENGGFRQFDRSTGYYTHITFNDNATNNVLQLLRAVAAENILFKDLTNDSIINKSKIAFERGIECILKTQYIQNGKKTVWCAQHDEITLLPAKARAYELPSLSGSESVGLVQLLMDLPNPDHRIKDAIDGAMEWFDNNRIKDYRIERFTNDQGKYDLRWIKSSTGEDLWGRFCDLVTNRAFVSDRDGIVKYDISEIGYERRTGYGWYSSEPNKLFTQYAKWKELNQK